MLFDTVVIAQIQLITNFKCVNFYFQNVAGVRSLRPRLRLSQKAKRRAKAIEKRLAREASAAAGSSGPQKYHK